MTVVAWDGKTLAADTLHTCNRSFDSFAPKVWRERGCLIGVAGSMINGERFREWVRGGMNGRCPLEGLADDQRTNAILVAPDRRLVVWCSVGAWSPPVKRYAIGAGQEYALGAMAAGATAEQAARIATGYQTDCGGLITALTL